jgi:hypothetical protein
VSVNCGITVMRTRPIPCMRAHTHFSRVINSGLYSTMVISFFAVSACDLFFLLCACIFFLLFNSCFLMESTHQRALFWEMRLRI